MEPPIRVPVLQVHGEDDPAVLLSTAQASHQNVVGPYRMVRMPGVGHFPQEERPADMLPPLTQWLASVTR
jgi:pimeloyl-ACP methyl ester carboxylesterase